MALAVEADTCLAASVVPEPWQVASEPLVARAVEARAVAAREVEQQPALSVSLHRLSMPSAGAKPRVVFGCQTLLSSSFRSLFPFPDSVEMLLALSRPNGCQGVLRP